MSRTGGSRNRMIAIYATGQFGWSLASYGVLNLLAYFYMPLQEAGVDGAASTRLFPAFLFQGSVLAGLTVIGLIGFGGRIFDAITDPMVAHWSDGSKSRFGRRRVFLLMAALPFAFFSAAVFFPPFGPAFAANTGWLLVCITLFYFFMTLYVVPYNALIAELGQTARERLHLATAISVTWALGFASGAQIYVLQDVFEGQGMDSLAAFQRSLLLFSGIAAAAMLVPALFLDEHRYTKRSEGSQAGQAEGLAMGQAVGQAEGSAGTPPLATQGVGAGPTSNGHSGNVRAAFRQVWSNRNFRWFALSDFLYWLALTFIQMGVAYYVVALMGRDKSYASAFMLLVFVLSFVCYVPVNLAAQRWGKRNVLLGAFLCFGGAFALTASLQTGSAFSGVAILLLQGMAAVALAAFGILPNAIVGDLADTHSQRAGESLAGMYFAVRTLIMKLGTSAAMLIFPTFLLWETGGIRASALAALIFCLAGFLAFRQYKETADGEAVNLKGRS
ncbi:MAG: MFS transporter [Bacteroidetes bacterium]|nr:MFS transporter [Bacteroidota bacterium]